MIFRNAVEPGRYLLSQTRRLYHSSNGNEALNIAVLGGGITGLATAYFITRDLPGARVTLFEASSRLGGWLHSQQVDIGNGTVVFEQGPRILRPSKPNGWVTIDLVSKHSHRYIHLLTLCLASRLEPGRSSSFDVQVLPCSPKSLHLLSRSSCPSPRTWGISLEEPVPLTDGTNL